MYSFVIILNNVKDLLSMVTQGLLISLDSSLCVCLYVMKHNDKTKKVNNNLVVLEREMV